MASLSGFVSSTRYGEFAPPPPIRNLIPNESLPNLEKSEIERPLFIPKSHRQRANYWNLFNHSNHFNRDNSLTMQTDRFQRLIL